ncbi:MAG TPA: ATP-binding protein [Pyrinomonadaceae bacterium]|nr:ATP-binding protein [Pyrinomonadaceae bacterium]
MNLFFKIFLWFLAAIALMVGAMLFLNWTVQTEPVVSRWRISVRNQTNIYAATAAQIFNNEGEDAFAQFIDRIRNSETVTEVDVVGQNGKVWPVGAEIGSYRELISNALTTDVVEIDNQTDTALSAQDFEVTNGDRYVLIIRWDRPKPTPFFGESPLRYARYGALFLTALLLCYALARYLSSPIGKIRMATRKLAGGDLKTRVADEIGGRHDELGSLARDFDDMAERIESLVTSQQRLSRDISHELRSPLARMNVALEIAKQKSNGNLAPQLKRIEAESTRLNEMISSLLTLSKLESGSRDFERTNVNLKKLVEQVASDADFEANAVGKSVRLLQADNCRILANENLVRSAVENVLRNAVRYTREGTSAEVSLTSANGISKVTVLDHGGGVPVDELDKLFRPFYRVGEARERKTGGIGIGLAIAEQAIKAHKGSIRAKNSGDGLLVEISLECV